MSVSWEKAKRELLELQDRSPKPLLIELTYKDDERADLRREVLTLNEVLERDYSKFWTFRIVSGSNLKEAKRLLEWIAPESIIK